MMQPSGQMYRDHGAGRLYLCAGCNTPQRGPEQGGAVVCSRCHTPADLADRSALLATAPQVGMPSNDPARLAQLRVQDGQPRTMSSSLQTVLGGQGIGPGREQEAFMLWHNLRGRAAQGDMAASEDLSSLTVLLTQLPSLQGQPDFDRAVFESALDAAALPRHRQQHLGSLARNALVRGDRAGAQRYLSWMTPNPPELESDSQFRISSAVAATADRDPQRVLALLGAQKDAVPIADWMDDIATVFRANAYEMMGNVVGAQQSLGQLARPDSLAGVRGVYAALQLCPQAAGGYAAQQTQASAQRAASSAGMIGMLVGGILAVTGFGMLAVGVVMAVASDGIGGVLLGGGINGVIGGVMLAIGVTVVVKSRAKGRHAAWLATNGVPLEARVTNADLTGTVVNGVPIFQISLQVMGPQGPYPATLRKLVPPHEIAQLVGHTVRVRANPQKLEEVIFEQ